MSANSTASIVCPQSIFSEIKPEVPDPILTLNNQYAEDKNPKKVNLAVGYYYDQTGKIPEYKAAKEAKDIIRPVEFFKGYLPIDGFPAFNQQTARLIFGDNCAALKDGRIATIQTIGGTGALGVGAKLLLSGKPAPKEAWVSDPSWPNHVSIFSELGYDVKLYRYPNVLSPTLDSKPILNQLTTAQPGSVVLLQVCCHNPTGLDFSSSDWSSIFDICLDRNLIPFFDMAYQGFYSTTDEDAAPIRKFIETGACCLISSSFSKNLSMYNERVGSLSVVVSDAQELPVVLGRVKKIIRSRYSNPPSFGARTAAEVLKNQSLRTLWEQELKEARERMKKMRLLFVEKLEKKGFAQFDFIKSQHGMFSMTGIPLTTIQWLRENKSIYVVDSGRACLASLNENNIDYVVDSIAEHLQK